MSKNKETKRISGSKGQDHKDGENYIMRSFKYIIPVTQFKSNIRKSVSNLFINFISTEVKFERFLFFEFGCCTLGGAY